MKFSCAAAIIIAAVSPRAIAADLNPVRPIAASPDNDAADLNPGRFDTAILDADAHLDVGQNLPFGPAKVRRLHRCALFCIFWAPAETRRYWNFL
jgi:hypothetical protein